jgi:glycosyltransferase involved in cell wall biosynthesis
MSNNRTLIILSPGFPANEADTTCVPALQTFVKALKQTYPALNFIVIAFQYPFFERDYSFYGVRVISLNGRNKGKFNKLKTWLKAWRTLTKINKENDVIGILSFWLSECAFVGQWFAKRNSLKHFIWLLGQDAKPGNIFYRLTRPHATNLIALSDFITHEFFKNYRVTPQNVIPIGIDTSLFKNQQVERDIDILGAGSLIPLKQYDLFVDVIKNLIPDFSKMRVVMCGDGPEKETIHRLIKECNLQSNISLLGEVSHPAVLALMERSRIFLHTSNYEGFGAVHAEALYAGAHVISFTKPMNNTFEHYCHVKNKEEMIQMVKGILKNKQVRHEPVLMYSVTDVAQQMMSLFSH